jgi:hypothetical protein
MNLVTWAVAACTFLVVYYVVVRASHWYSPSTLVMVAVALSAQTIIDLAISRIGRRFDKT